MPTKPHAKLSLDEAVDASTWRHKPVTRKRATTAGILGLFFGYMGIHDFILHHKKRGFIHMLFTTIAFGMFFIPFAYGLFVVYGCRHPELKLQCVDISDYDDILNIIMTVGLVLTVVAIIWGIVEAIIILAHRNSFPEK